MEDIVAGWRHSYRDMIARQRRAILIGLGTIWFLALLAMLAVSWEAGGKADASRLFGQFWTSLSGPAGWFLLLATAFGLASHLLFPRRIDGRWRRWLRTEGFTAPHEVSHRLDETGLASREPHIASHMPWARIAGLAETPSHAFVRLDGVEEAVILPRSALGEDGLARLRAWIAHAAGRAPADGEAMAGEASGEDALTLSYQPSAEDRAAALARQQERPALRSLRWRGFALAGLIAVLIFPALLAFFWAIDPDRVPFAIALPLFAEMFLSSFLWPAAIGILLVAALALVHPRLRRMQARQIGEELHRQHNPGETRLALSDAGIAVTTRGGRSHYDWAAFGPPERQGQHLFLPIRHGDALVIPARCLDSDRLARFDELAARHLGRATSAKREGQ